MKEQICDDKKSKTKQFHKVYDRLFSVDYTSDDNNKCILDLPFTFYDWRRIEIIQNTLKPDNLRGRSALETELKWLTPKKIRTCCLNILPKCDTVLHKASSNFDFAKFITYMANESDTPEKDKFYIPFIPNMYGDTPLHLCIDGEN